MTGSLIKSVHCLLRMPQKLTKNISLLRKYVTENSKIISSKITSVSMSKQRKLTKEIKKAKALALI